MGDWLVVLDVLAIEIKQFVGEGVKTLVPRYTDTPVDEFGKYILLTNFISYVHEFARMEQAEIRGRARPMQTATSSDGITLINFGIGSPSAATICDLLSVVQPHAVLFLGKCGGLKDFVHVGDFILPIAAIRAEGTSDSSERLSGKSEAASRRYRNQKGIADASSRMGSDHPRDC